MKNSREDYEFIVNLIGSTADEITKTVLRRLLATLVAQEGMLIKDDTHE